MKSVKFPDGYASKISSCVNTNTNESKMVGLKSHDCHVLLQRIFPIGIRKFLRKDICETIDELGNFFQQLCCKTLRRNDLEKLEKDIVFILCKLERNFPPAFFDVMIHLAVHLPSEAILGGPVQYRWMFPFGRYLSGIETKFDREERNNEGRHVDGEDKLFIFTPTRPFGSTKYADLEKEDVNTMHWYILSNCEEVDPYLKEHEDILKREGVDDRQLKERQREQFPKWFLNQLTSIRNGDKLIEQLYCLARGPDPRARRYSGCIVNVVRFHTSSRDKNLKTQNSGVMVERSHATNKVIERVEFYGVVNDIIELEYIFYSRDRKSVV